MHLRFLCGNTWGERLSSIQAIPLIRGETRERVSAELVYLSDKHIEDFDRLWQPLLLEFDEPDAGLSWDFKQRRAAEHENYECYAIEYDNLTQGLLMLETQNHWSQFDWGKRLVYVEHIMTAPWNRTTIQRPGRFKGVGTALMAWARRRSQDLGYRGRVGLESLPRAVQFYDGLGMMRLELEPHEIVDADEKLPYFEYRALRQRREADDE